MKRKDILVDHEQMYALTQGSGGGLFLEVVTGGFAMENIVFQLNEAEVANYTREGRAFLDELAQQVRKETSRFRSRVHT